MKSLTFGPRARTILLLLLSTMLCACPWHNFVPVHLTIEISPNSATVGDSDVALTVSVLNGGKFDDGDQVSFHDVVLKGTRTAQQITTKIPANLLTTAGTFPVKVVNTNNNETVPVSNSVPFTVNPPSGPTITSISPSTVLAGSGAFFLLVNGKNFAKGALANVGGISISPSTSSSTFLAVSISNLTASLVFGTPGSVRVTVTNPNNGGTSNAVTLTVVAGPRITSISPTLVMAGVGTTLAVTGSGFVSGSVVMINGLALTTSFTDSMHLFAVLPGSAVPAPGTSQITVVNPPPLGGTSNAVTLTITQSSTLAINPTTIPDGFVGTPYTQVLTVTGGTGPFTWSVSSGTLPMGLTLVPNGATATISGTPTTTQTTVMFTITVADTSDNATFPQSYTVSINSSGGNGNNGQVTGDYVLEFAARGSQGIETDVLTGHADGNGNITNCLLTRNSVAQILNKQPCATSTYDVAISGTGRTQVFYSATGDSAPSNVVGYLDANKDVNVTRVAATAGAPLGGSGQFFKRNLSGVTQASLAGAWVGAFFGDANGILTILMSDTFDPLGNGMNAFMAVSVPGGTQTSPGSITLGAFDPITGCFPMTASVANLTSPPAPATSLTMNGIGCAKDANSIQFISTDPRTATTAVVIGTLMRAASGLTANSTLSGPAVGRLALQATTSAAAGQQTFQVNSNGSGGVTSGLMDQSQGGTATLNMVLGGSYSFDGVHNGFATIDFTATGGTPINSHFTIVASGTNTAFIMAGTPANPTMSPGIGVFSPQTAVPCTSPDTAFGFGSNIPFVVADPPAGGPAASGNFNYGDGVQNQVVGSNDAVNNGVATTNNTISGGAFKALDPATCRFTGTLVGLFSNSSVPITGYVVAPQSAIIGLGDALLVVNDPNLAP